MTVKILRGDCRQVLKTLPNNSVHCCVTSPPYFGLRSYLPDNHPEKHLEIGSEPTLEAWVQTMVEVFREVRRVLRPDGTLWLNLGDAYAGQRAPGGITPSARRDDEPIPRSDRAVAGLKPKDMMGQPWRVAFALQADGWWLRQEIIWSKPNPMPESTRDRCTKAHEHVFLLSKSERYFYDFDAMQEPVTGGANARGPGNVRKVKYDGVDGSDGEHRTKGGLVAYAERQRAKKYSGNGVGFGHGYDKVAKPRSVGVNPKAAQATVDNAGGYADGKSERMGRGAGWRVKQNESFSEAISGNVVDTRNPRTVWTIPTHGFKGAHFATFPPALAERCITAGCPEGGTVLDPFGGSGTVGMVADRQHKSAILIDLDERNVPMASDRIRDDAGMFAEVQT